VLGATTVELTETVNLVEKNNCVPALCGVSSQKPDTGSYLSSGHYPPLSRTRSDLHDKRPVTGTYLFHLALQANPTGTVLDPSSSFLMLSDTRGSSWTSLSIVPKTSTYENGRSTSVRYPPETRPWSFTAMPQVSLITHFHSRKPRDTPAASTTVSDLPAPPLPVTSASSASTSPLAPCPDRPTGRAGNRASSLHRVANEYVVGHSLWSRETLTETQ
jgi:hypothetical protein